MHEHAQPILTRADVGVVGRRAQLDSLKTGLVALVACITHAEAKRRGSSTLTTASSVYISRSGDFGADGRTDRRQTKPIT